MSKPSGVVRLRGVRHNNLKNFDLDLPLNQLIVITGLSGSGKSSLAFDTLFAEGQRRYIETFSPYARQFLDRMDKPQVDSIEGIPPAIAIEQRNSVKTTRSTVGTMTEICDYMKVLWPHISQLHCRQCDKPVRKDSPQDIWTLISQRKTAEGEPKEILITFDLPLTDKLSLQESLALIAKQGYQRLLLDGRVARLEEIAALPARHPSRVGWLTVVQDRIRPTSANRARLVEACEQAYHFGKGKLAIYQVSGEQGQARADEKPLRLSNRLHCAQCDIEYRETSPALFSFNHPVGACPACRGFGRIISIDYNLALPDRSKTLAEGVVKPWQTGTGLESQHDLLRMCRHFEIPTNVPFARLAKKWQDFVLEGEPGYGQDEEHQWPRAWYGVKGYFRWLESRAYKMHVRVLLSRYRAYTTCPDCGGQRFQPDALLYRAAIGNRLLTLADFYQLPIRDACQFVSAFGATHGAKPGDPVGTALNEVRTRLVYLEEVGLDYLTLDRPTRSLSGGETERVSLTTCLGTRLVNTLFVLDEPSVGLHPRDTERLVRVLQDLRDAGNTVVVVEHEAAVMRAANHIIDLGPGHGATGGQVVFQGPFSRILKSSESLTGKYLSGSRSIEIPARRPIRVDSAPGRTRFGWPTENEALLLNDAPFASTNGTEICPVLKISGASRHNLKNLAVSIPLRRFVCVTGVSGSGKSTLLREVLLPGLAARLNSLRAEVKASDRFATDQNGGDEDDAGSNIPTATVDGVESIDRAILVDQSILAKTPRSNPAVYIGAFDDIREVFSQSDVAKQRGLNASAFSFNSAQGQCERCRGAGFEKIEMQFLSDVFIRCPDCDGRRYRSHILEIKLSSDGALDRSQTGPRKLLVKLGRRKATANAKTAKSIADLLDSTVDEAIEFLKGFPDSRSAAKAADKLKLLEEVGLGYLKLGQPINTLSGGESQRLKLVRHLAEAQLAAETSLRDRTKSYLQRGGGVASLDCPKGTLFLFDEPTTGLHFDDVRVLLRVFQRLVDAGHSVIVIEHNIDVIKSADWVIDLGPEAGDRGGEIVAQGTPEQIAAHPGSHTGTALRNVLSPERLLTAITTAKC
jgi:excinuclease ABC subunit A